VESIDAAKIFVFLFLILCAAFFTGSETALFTLGPYRVRRLRNKSVPTYQAAQRLLKNPNRLITTLLIGNEFINASIGIIGSTLVYSLFKDKVSPEYLSPLAVVLVLPVLVILGEIVPKTIGMRSSEMVVYIIARPLFLFSKAVAPLRNGLTWISEKVFFLFGTAPMEDMAVSEEMFRAMVDAGMEEGVVGPHEQRLIHNVFRLDDLQVSQIMRPKGTVVSIDVSCTLEQAMKKFEAERYSRFPVLDSEKEHVLGVLYLKDLLGIDPSKYLESVSKYIRSPLLVPTTINALQLFVQFRARQMHFAAVVDPSDQKLLGVVTLENVLEEIFGGLRDERDVEEGVPSKPL
jgi:putative hemolysin